MGLHCIHFKWLHASRHSARFLRSDLTNGLRHCRIADNGFPKRRIRGCKHGRKQRHLENAELIKHAHADDEAKQDRQRQSDQQQTKRETLEPLSTERFALAP